MTGNLIIIIIIAFKGAVRDFLQSPHSAVNCLQHARSSGLGAVVCKSRATHRALITCKCRVTCHLVRRDSSAIKCDRIEIAFIWAYFVGWIIKPMKEGRKPEYPEKTPGDELQRVTVRKESSTSVDICFSDLFFVFNVYQPYPAQFSVCFS